MAEKVTFVVRPFPLSSVRLLDGLFKSAQDRHAAYLLTLEPDRFLSGFRTEAGLTPKAEKYGGWESMGVAGHNLGHYLSGCAYAYRSTGNEAFKERIAYIVSQLAECQAANGDGSLNAFPNGKRVFDEVARGDIRSQGFDLNGIWVPWYTIHKVMAGLRDSYQLCDNEQALQVLKRMANWSLHVTDRLSEEKLQLMLACEHGGMNEVAADLYSITGEEKYLTLANRFYHHKVLDPLSRGEDNLRGLHANTQVPKLIGLARLFELTAEPKYKNAAETFWTHVVSSHSYVIGGNSDGEHFGPPKTLSKRLGENTAETCNTYNMLKLTRHLFEWTGDPHYAEFYERALYNHILASENPKTSAVTYFVPLRYGAEKKYQGLYDAFTCCVGTGMENHVKYGESIYFQSDDALWVNLYIASELDWKDGIKVKLDTKMPYDGNVKLSIASATSPTRFKLKLRRPAWAGEGTAMKVNGEAVADAAIPGEYIEIDRQWKAGDTVELAFPIQLRLEATSDNPDMIALLAGPVVLAGRVGEAGAMQTALVPNDRTELLKNIEPEAQPLHYKTHSLANPADVELVPFFEAHEFPYTVYFNVFDHATWATAEARFRERLKFEAEKKARTVDQMVLGEMQPERDHNFTGEKTRNGQHLDKKWRDAFDGGWFEFDVGVDPKAQNELVCTYWGNDANGREFDVLIDGKVLLTQSLNGEKPGEFFDVVTPIPAELIRGKEKVRVRFQAHPGKTAGGCFGLSILRTK